jgi:predicted RNase H-like HicB family nuclease
MFAEFTAVFEPRPNGIYTGYIAEIPQVRTGAKTLEEARCTLAEQLRYYLEAERNRFLSRISSNAHIEPLRIKILPSQPTGTEVQVATASLRSPEASEPDLLQTLLERGLIDKIPLLPAAGTGREEHEPIPIEGKPISEEIIEGRR